MSQHFETTFLISKEIEYLNNFKADIRGGISGRQQVLYYLLHFQVVVISIAFIKLEASFSGGISPYLDIFHARKATHYNGIISVLIRIVFNSVIKDLSHKVFKGQQ